MGIIMTVFKGLFHQDGSASLDQMNDLAAALGDAQSQSIFEDSLAALPLNKTIDSLVDTDCGAWVLNRNPILVSFLSKATQIDPTSGEKRTKKLYALTKAVDQVYYARNLNFISPFGFSENLVSFCVTNNKMDDKLRGIASPSGSHSTVL
jgi:hypothetical protein